MVPGRLGFSLPAAGGTCQTRPWTLPQVRFCGTSHNTIRIDPSGSDNGHYVYLAQLVCTAVKGEEKL